MRNIKRKSSHNLNLDSEALRVFWYGSILDFRKTWMNEKWIWNKSRLTDQVFKLDTPAPFFEGPAENCSVPSLNIITYITII